MGGGMALPDFRPRKCGRKKKKQQLEDRISCLPDYILVYILSLMRLEDAMRTSVLSKRWIDLWKFVPSLDFDSASDLGLEAPQEMQCYLESTCLKRQKYVSSVNKALQSHKFKALEIFKICFSLDFTYKDHIDKWFQYAFARKVERLEFCLPTFHGGNHYAFPCRLHGHEPRVSIPQFPKLKQFTLSAMAFGDCSDMKFTYIMRAAPNLEKFILEMGWMNTVYREPREHVRAINFQLEHLKEVELRGYYGRTAEGELVEYLLQNAVNLHKIVVDPRNQPFYGLFDGGISKEMENRAKMYANLVKELIPSHVELVIM